MAVVFLLFLGSPFLVEAQVYINEIMPSNESIIADNFGEYDDWIEIYNSGASPVDLNGYYLSDNPDNPSKFLISSTLVVPAGGYALFWADEDQLQGFNHTNFKLSASGEFVMLTDPNGVSVIDSFSFGSVLTNLSFGRIQDASSTLDVLSPPSPQATNNNSLSQFSVPVISPKSGVYTGSQQVTIQAPVGCTIYYTLDGSEPTASSLVYNNPIAVNSNQTIRAACITNTSLTSQVATETYLINTDHDVAVISISMDPDHLWSDQEGMYVGGTNGVLGCGDSIANFYQDWEYAGNVIMFDEANNCAFNVHGGLSIFGNCSRRYAQKSIQLKTKSKFQSEDIPYQVFPTQEQDEYRRLRFRNGGNHWLQTLFADAVFQRILENEVDLDIQPSRPSVMYLNDEYWGIHNLRTSYSRHYFRRYHPKFKDDDFDILRMRNLATNYEVMDGDSLEMQEIVAYFNANEPFTSADYDYATSKFDISNFINYYTSHIWLRPRDWPATGSPANQIFWKSKTSDSKWRIAVLDTDAGWHEPEQNTIVDMLIPPPDGEGRFAPQSTLFFRRLMDVPEFRAEFIQRLSTQMNTIFDSNNVNAEIDNYRNLLEPEINDHLAMWGPQGGVPDYDTWVHEIDSLKSFGPLRNIHLRDSIEQFYNLSEVNLSFSFDANTNGRVQLNSNFYAVPFNYSGQYFANTPIEIHAVPDPGYRFSHWQETGNTNPSLYQAFSTNTNLTPVFVPAQDLVINEIHYNPNGSSEAAEFVEIYNPDANAKPLHFFEFGEGICFEFPEGTTIGPGEYVVIANDASVYQGNGYQVFEFEFSNLDNDGEHLSLINRNNQVIDSLTYNDGGDWIGVADGGFYSLALLDHTLDNALAASWDVQSVYITPGAPNQFLPFDTYHAPSDVVINEIHYHPFQTITSSGDTISSRNFEFIELKNLTSSPVSLTGVALSRGITYEFPIGAVLPANGFIVLAEDSLEYINRYGQSPYGTYSGKLSNSGEMIWLSDVNGELLDAVRYDDVFPWDNQADGGLNDFSLALIDSSLPNDTHINWRRQCTALHTPGQENDFGCFQGQEADGLIINEIDYNPNEASGIEFVELFNNSFVPINLEGLLISDAITYQFPSGQLLPGQYYIIARDSALFENTYNVAVDGSFSGGLSSQGETILISDFFENTVDIVSYDVTPPWTNEPAQGIKSLALIDPDLNNNNGFNWCVQQSDRTPKAANDFADTDNDGIVDCIDSCPALDNDLIGTACDDGDPCTPTSIYTTNCNCEAVENAALAGTASMSSQFSSFVASNLNNDRFTGNSELAHTGGSSPNEWFEIDLGSDMQISSVVLWNRINCCSSRINNVYIMVADTPFPANTDLTQSLNNSDYTHQLGDETGSAIITVYPNASGRYVRIQKSGNNDGGNFMNLRELQVFTPVTIVDTDNDGDCDIIDQCPNFDNNLIGQSCDDNDPCTTGDVYTSNCACEGTVVGDADNDGICDTIDQCPNFDDTLIGTTCDDNDPCTTNDLYTNTCDCMGTAVADSDGDGLCNAIDVCPNFDDNLIGTACDDNDPCTTNDLYTNTCDCVGTVVGDSDGDGVCNAIDQCPNFDDNLIGTPCDDGIICFVGSTWDANCNCSGGAFSDLDNDNVCDPLDQCPGSDDNVDVNTNGIPDGCEGCADYITESTNSIISSDRSANINITTNGRVFIGDIEYHAGQDIDLTPGFEVKSGAVFHAYIAPCN